MDIREWKGWVLWAGMGWGRAGNNYQSKSFMVWVGCKGVEEVAGVYRLGRIERVTSGYVYHGVGGMWVYGVGGDEEPCVWSGGCGHRDEPLSIASYCLGVLRQIPSLSTASASPPAFLHAQAARSQTCTDTRTLTRSLARSLPLLPLPVTMCSLPLILLPVSLPPFLPFKPVLIDLCLCDFG